MPRRPAWPIASEDWTILKLDFLYPIRNGKAHQQIHSDESFRFSKESGLFVNSVRIHDYIFDVIEVDETGASNSLNLWQIPTITRIPSLKRQSIPKLQLFLWFLD
jgi:hypothetical protein